MMQAEKRMEHMQRNYENNISEQKFWNIMLLSVYLLYMYNVYSIYDIAHTHDEAAEKRVAATMTTFISYARKKKLV